MLTIKQLLARHARELRPSDGDPAYARHDGRELLGVLHDVRHEAKRFTATLMPNVVEGKHEWWGPHDHTPGISVRNLRWDKHRAVWIGTTESQ
jgi:hypothetical protein